MNNQRLFPCELHCHTLHSDGQFSVPELISTAKERLLEGICLTDHNTVSGHAEARDSKLAILKGIEWTTYFGHMKVLGCEKYVDWRDVTPDTIDEKNHEIKKQSALIGIAHPFQPGTPICTGGHWDFKVKDFSKIDYIEIWSEGCPFLNSANKKAQKMWHGLLDKGYRITPTFGRDWHRKEGNISPAACTYLLCEDKPLTEDMMKQAIADGKTVVSVGPAFLPRTRQGVTPGDTLKTEKTSFYFEIKEERMKFLSTQRIEYDIIKVITRGSAVLFEVPFSEKEVTFIPKKGNWYSFELWGRLDGEYGQLAVTAPFYCE